MGSTQPVFGLEEIEDAGNSEFGGEFLGPHRSFLSPESIIADCGGATTIFGGSRSGRRFSVISQGTGDDTNSVRPPGSSGNITPPAMP
jgi:hypothetical protein